MPFQHQASPGYNESQMSAYMARVMGNPQSQMNVMMSTYLVTIVLLILATS